jgi:DNA-binding beta-propeller fold protein YncE
VKSISLLALVPAIALAQPKTGRILVANQQAASASIIELSTGAVTHIPVGNGPHEAAISPDGKWGFISVYGLAGQPGNQIAVIDMAEKKLVRSIDLGTYTRPHGVVPVAGSPLKLIVTSETTQNVLVVDAEAGKVISVVPTGAQGSHMVAVPTDAKRAFTANVGSGSMTAVGLVEGKALGAVSIGPRSEGIATTPDGNQVWIGMNDAGTVSVVDTRSMTVDTTLAGFSVPYRMAVSPDSRLVAVCEAGGGRIALIDRAARRSLGAVDVGGSPRGVSISPDSRFAFVTLGPENAVVVVDLASRSVVSRYGVQTAPDGVAYRP